jgi:hypothetical protein
MDKRTKSHRFVGEKIHFNTLDFSSNTTVVWMGEPQPAQAVDQSGADVEVALGEHPDVSAASDHQRGDGGIELEDSDDQIQRTRLLQLRELPDSHPVLLRQAQPLPIMKPEEGIIPF